MSFSVKVKKEIEPDLLNQIRDAVIDGLTEVGSFVRNIAAEHVPEYDGALRNSLDYKVNEPELTVTVFSNLEYAAAREFGIPAGYQNPPPAKALYKWVKDKWGGEIRSKIKESHKKRKGGRTLSQKVDSAIMHRAIMLAKHISEKGVEERPYLRPAVEEEVSSIMEIMRRNLGDLLDQ